MNGKCADGGNELIDVSGNVRVDWKVRCTPRQTWKSLWTLIKPPQDGWKGGSWIRRRLNTRLSQKVRSTLVHRLELPCIRRVNVQETVTALFYNPTIDFIHIQYSIQIQ